MITGHEFLEADKQQGYCNEVSPNRGKDMRAGLALLPCEAGYR
jgi:hypothetical protein